MTLEAGSAAPAAGSGAPTEGTPDPKEAAKAEKVAADTAAREKFVRDFKAKAGIKDPPPKEEAKTAPAPNPAEGDHAANMANLAKRIREFETSKKAADDAAKAERDAIAAERKKHADEIAADREELERLKRVRALGKEGKIADAYMEALGTEDVPVELLQELVARGGKAKVVTPDQLKAEMQAYYKEQRAKEEADAKAERERLANETNATVQERKTNYVMGVLKDPNGPKDDPSNRTGGVHGYFTEHATEYPAISAKGAPAARILELAQEGYKATGRIPDPKDVLDYIEAEIKEKLRADAAALGLLPEEKKPVVKPAPTSIGNDDKRGADLNAEEEEEQGEPDKFLPAERRAQKHAALATATKAKMAATLAKLRGG